MKDNRGQPSLSDLWTLIQEQRARIEDLESQVSRKRRTVRIPTRLFAVLLSLGLALAVSGNAFAAIPDTGGEIHGCYVLPTRLGSSLIFELMDTAIRTTCPGVATPLNWNAYVAPGAAGHYMRSNGTTWTSSGLQLGDVPDLSGSYVKLDGSNATPGKTWGINVSGTSAGFTGSLSGDVTRGQSSTKVVALQGQPVDSSTPTDGQVLTYSNTDGKWEPKAVSSSLSTQVAWSTHSVACCVDNYQTFDQSCPSGYSVTGGGFDLSEDSQHIFDSHPQDSSTWRVVVTDDLGPHDITVYADCVKFSP
jgi:hypothetical protein